MRGTLALLLLSALLAGCASSARPTPAPAGYPITWSNPEGGTSGTATPARAEPATCREFQQTITIAGKPEQAWGRACRQPDGSWRIVSD